MSPHIPDQCIVVFKSTATKESCDECCKRAEDLCSSATEASQCIYKWSSDNLLRGFCLKTTDREIWDKIKCWSEVDFIEPDFPNDTLFESDSPINVLFDQTDESGSTNGVPQPPQRDNRIWGLSRISRQTMEGAQTADTNTKFEYNFNPAALGEGTVVYVMDSGVLMDHKELHNRVLCEFDVLGSQPPSGELDEQDPREDDKDALRLSDDGEIGREQEEETQAALDNGHGTHIAGIIGGTTWGVAKKTKMISVRVLGPGGRASHAIEGLRRIVRDIEDEKNGRKYAKCLVNISFVTSLYSRALNEAVTNAVKKGLWICASAGNNRQDARMSSPGSSELVMTVGGITREDHIYRFSNHGPRVNILAPAKHITSCWNSHDTASRVLSGTSMAAAFVTGVAACLISGDPSLNSPDKVNKKLESLAVRLESLRPSTTQPWAKHPRLLVHNGMKSSESPPEKPVTILMECPRPPQVKVESEE